MASHSTVHAGTLPYWADSASLPVFPKLDRDLDVDVVVVGGGITGLTAAYLLTVAGRSVALLERDRCAAVDTGHTSAHLTMVTDVRLGELVKGFGRSHAQAAWDAGLAAMAQIDDIARKEQIDCGLDWIDGYLHAPGPSPSKEDIESLREDAQLAQELGFDAEFVSSIPFIGLPGIRFESQARFHPRRYLAGLAHVIRERGGHIFEHSGVEEFVEKPFGAKARGHLVQCRDVVIATHNPLSGFASMISASLFQTKLGLYTSYVVAGRAPKGAVPDALFWDTGDPYEYLRIEPHRDHDLVIFGGEDHKTGQERDTNACYERLERAIRAQLPAFEPTHRWSGQVIETPDGLPYIGEMTDHQYASTGYAGNGLTFGTLGAMLMADRIQQRKNPWDELFDPGRKALTRSLWDYLRENADYPYYMIRDRFAGAESRTLRAVKRGEGKIVDHKGTKVAAYRDPNGSLTLRSATCTHLGCLVNWNDAEKTWDCPCHGSRFATSGQVISGPAETPLEEIKS